MAIIQQDNFNDLLPAATSGMQNAKWQADAPATNPRNVSAQVRNFGAVDARTTATETVGLASQGKTVTFNFSTAIAVTLDSTVPATYYTLVEVIGSGQATFTPSAGAKIYGPTGLVSSLTLFTGASCIFFFDGTNWYALCLAAVGTPVENEVVTFSGTTGTLANTPSSIPGYTQVKLYRNGIRMNPGGGNDFTVSGKTITLAIAVNSADIVFLADYYK